MNALSNAERGQRHDTNTNQSESKDSLAGASTKSKPTLGIADEVQVKIYYIRSESERLTVRDGQW